MTQAINYTENSKCVPEGAVNITIGDVFDKAIILSALAKSCRFPDYFSHNWDSAWDCLTDSNITQLRLSLAGVKEINNKDLESFKTLFIDAYQTYGKPQLWIVEPTINKMK